MLDLTGTEAGTETGNETGIETGTETGTEQNNCASWGNPFCWLGDAVTLWTLCTGTTLSEPHLSFLFLSPPGGGGVGMTTS